MSRRTVIVAFFVATVALAGVASYWSSDQPDGLESAVTSAGLHPDTDDADSPAGPLADYKMPGVGNRFVANALAGLVGAVGVLGPLLLVGRLLARRPTKQ